MLSNKSTHFNGFDLFSANTTASRVWNHWKTFSGVTLLILASGFIVLFVLTGKVRVSFNTLGRENNEIAPEDIDVTFDDVKGCDEVGTFTTLP